LQFVSDFVLRISSLIFTGMDKAPSSLSRLADHCFRFGASAARIIPTGIIPVQEAVIAMCREPLCPGYGKSAHCPPNGIRPAEARKRIRQFPWAVLFKLDVPTEILLRPDRYQAFKKVYQVVRKVEVLALKEGFTRSWGLAAGSCKPVFCPDRPCRALEEGGSCCYPTLARPSLEAVGIHVFNLIREAGWEIEPITRESDPQTKPMGLLAGLILVH
jgi:predicted metal-binding protein